MRAVLIEGLGWDIKPPRTEKTKRKKENKPFIQINISLLTNQIRISASHALDLRERVHDLLLAVDIGIEETEDELEVRLLA